MTTYLADLFSLDLLADCLRDRLVVAKKHTLAPLTILNYTARCQYEDGLWNPVTQTCRGLIHDDHGRVIARPFRKFFNLGQSESAPIELSARCTVTDKLDGSLGILYPVGDVWAVATRGAFEGKQAQHATDLLRARYPEYRPPPGWTVLVEIIYPSNRIVLDYGDQDDLVLLGAVEIASGRSVGPPAALLADWPGPRANVFDDATVADALAAPARANAEGFVLHLVESDERVKVKQEDYIVLHRIVSGLNERTVWEHLVAGNSAHALLDALPDEFHGWVGEVAARLLATVDTAAADVERAYSAILADLAPTFTRKEFALLAKEHPRRTQLFARHDGKDYRRSLWEEAFPPPDIGPRGAVPSEETA
jgi:RNA ligase